MSSSRPGPPPPPMSHHDPYGGGGNHHDPHGVHIEEPPPGPTNCSKFLRFCRQVFGFFFSHIGLLSLVVGYCIMGAFIFEELEKGNEIMVKRNMTKTREAVTETLWDITREMEVLRQDNWTTEVTSQLRRFEKSLIIALKEKGWDGKEDEENVTWTFAGALFYSITVITTIGYGHIAPKTAVAKIVTIFYAICGIPLTVLCWSNIGDAMANAFRFSYWRIFCYLCTKKPKKRRRRAMSRHSRAMSVRHPSRGRSLRRSQRTSQRSDDTARSDSTNSYSISDPDRFYEDGGMDPNYLEKGLSIPPARMHISSGGGKPPHGGVTNKPQDLDLELITQPLPNDNQENQLKQPPPAPEKKPSTAARMARGLGLKRGDRESQKSQKSNVSGGSDSVPSTPLNFGHGQIPNRGGAMRQFSAPNMRLDRVPENDWVEEAYYYDEYMSEDDGDDYSQKSVPIWLSLCLVIAYIVWGAFIFQEWEGWSLLDSSYFCFITLTTIGFGDLVPNQQSQDGEQRLALCSLYLLFGIAMIAMSFNLVQEQVINSVKTLGKQLGILKDDDDDDDY